MLFLLANIFGWLVMPGQVLLLLCVAGTVLCALRRQKWGLPLLFAGVGGFVIIAVLPVDRWMIAPLENRFPQVIVPPPRVDGIIVLGGAVDTNRTEEHGIPALSWEAERMTTLATLARLYPNAKLVFTGGSTSLRPDAMKEAEVARRLFTGLGVDQSRMTYEDRSRTTFENADYTRKLMNPQPDEVWVLVTSANHMPRAVGVFRRVGWNVVPWPVAFKTPAHRGWAFMGSLSMHLAIVELAFHEWVGLGIYYLTGRSDDLFPGP